MASRFGCMEKVEENVSVEAIWTAEGGTGERRDVM